MVRTRAFVISVVIVCALSQVGRSDDITTESPLLPNGSAGPTAKPNNDGNRAPTLKPTESDASDATQSASFSESFAVGNAQNECWVEPKDDSAKFPHAYQIPGTEAWWKFGGYVKGDFIHDFQPAGTTDRFVPTTIPTDGSEGQNTLMQAKATRLSLDVRAPSEWGVVRGYVETDFFNDDAQLRIRHAYTEVGRLLAGQTWTVFTDPAGIPQTLDFESPIAFITLRQAQFRWTEKLGDNLKWAMSVENPNTTADDVVFTTIPGDTEQPLPDFAMHLKYKSDLYEWFIAGLFRDLAYRPDGESAQDRFGAAINLVGILHPTEQDKLIGQFVMGSGLGRYRSGFDLRLASPTTVDTITDIGACVGVMHDWNDQWSSNAAYSCALRRDEETDPPDTTRFVNYLAINLIWEPIDDTTLGVEYLFGTNEDRDGDSGSANRIQASVQYNFP